VVGVADRFRRVELRSVVADDRPAALCRPAVGPTLERCPEREQAPEPVGDAEMRFGRHVAEVVRYPSATDRHVTAAHSPACAANRLPPRARRRAVHLMEGHDERRLRAYGHDASLVATGSRSFANFGVGDHITERHPDFWRQGSCRRR